MDFKGKRIAFLGDSITEGVGVGHGDCAERYDKRIEASLGLAKTFNYGISGTRFAHQSKPSSTPRHDLCFCGRVYDIDRSADAVVVFGGTNDYGHGDAPFGTREDATPATYMGAVRFLMNFLTTEFAGKPIVFLTPARRNGDEDVYTLHQAGNSHARPLLPYVDAIHEIAAEYENVHVLDLYRKMGVNPNLAEHRDTYAPDGLHFNAAGHAIIARLLADLLVTL